MTDPEGKDEENSEEVRRKDGESSEKIRRKDGESSEITVDYELSDTQKGIVNILRIDKTLSAAKMAERLGMKSRSIEKNIKKLKELDILVRHGSPKGGYWEVKECKKPNSKEDNSAE